jgi:hypothetical protein
MSDLALVSSSKGETLHEHLMGELDGVEPEKRDALVEQVHQIIRAFGVIFGKMLQQAASRPPSPGYEPYHVRRGTNPILARGMGAIAVRSGTRTAAEEPRRRAIFDAIRFLAKAKKPTPAVLRRVQTLVNGAAQTSVIETAFYEAKLHEGEFIGLLIDCREGRPVNSAHRRDRRDGSHPPQDPSRAEDQPCFSSASVHIGELARGSPQTSLVPNQKEIH